MYRSKFEQRCADQLTNKGVVFEYEPFELEYFSKVRGGECASCGDRDVFKARWYTPDFVVKRIIIEAKGKFTSENRTKMLDVIKAWPEYDIRMWFMYDNKLSKSSKVRYSDWCEKHGIKYHVGKEAPPWIL